MPVNGILTQKHKELVAVGASIAAGCHSCTAHHFKAAREVGATETEIRQAVDDALSVRNSATMVMARLAEKHQGHGHVTEESYCSGKPLIDELVSIGSALAVNCTTSLETHLKAAQDAGATDSQIQTALGVARAVKKVAGEKVETMAKVIVSSTWPEADAVIGNGCGCQKTNGSQAGDAAGGCAEQKNAVKTSDVEAEAVSESRDCG